jgi:hypothetical protein
MYKGHSDLIIKKTKNAQPQVSSQIKALASLDKREPQLEKKRRYSKSWH